LSTEANIMLRSLALVAALLSATAGAGTPANGDEQPPAGGTTATEAG
jgi:hypothetical protein